MRLYLATVASPLGDLIIAVHKTLLCALEFSDEWPRTANRLRKRLGHLEFVEQADPGGVVSRVEAYFEGKVDALADMAIDPGGTPFQQQVWTELRCITPGHTVSYRELAQRVGCPAGCRAVGTANRLNPIAIVVPCHRVIGSDGSLRGYAGGLDRKRWLLAHEAHYSIGTTNGGQLRLS